ncbi:MAG: OmpA family protein [Bacteroidota bacterium]
MLAEFEAVRAGQDSSHAAQGLALTSPPRVEIVQAEAQPTIDGEGNEGVVFALMTKVEFGVEALAFESASATLPPEAERYLVPLAESLVAELAALLIIGYPDTVASPDAALMSAEQQMLAEERAAAVADFLSRQGVLSTRIQVVGSGEYDPAVEDERIEEDRARNRRVEVFIVHYVAASNA